MNNRNGIADCSLDSQQARFRRFFSHPCASIKIRKIFCRGHCGRFYLMLYGKRSDRRLAEKRRTKRGERDDEGRNDVARNGGSDGDRRVRRLKRRRRRKAIYYDDLYPAPASSVRNNKQRSLVILKHCIIRCSEMERLGQRP